MAIRNPIAGLSDPSILRSTEAKLAQAAIIANGKPTVSGSELILPSTTVATTSNTVVTTTSANNDPGDIVTVYSSNQGVYVSSIDQTIRQTVVNNPIAGVSSIIAGNNITITSTGSNGTGNVTININLDGNASNVLHGDGSWSADQTTYGNSNVAAYLPTYTGNIGGNVVTANLFSGNGSSLRSITGANVSGFVPNANIANTAFAVAGANVSGFVPNANVANTAFAVAAANVSGLGNIATINLTGSTSNVLYGNGVFAPAAGGGNVSELINGNNSFVLNSDGDVTFEGNVAGQGVDRGLEWDYGANANGVNSMVRQDNNGLTVRAWTENGGGANGYSAPVNIVTNQDANAKTWVFDGQGNLTVPTGSINSINDGGDLGAYITLTPDLGIAKLAARDTQSNVNYTNTSWSTATYTGTQVDFTNAPDLVAFFNTNRFNVGVNQIFSINGGEPVPFTGYSTGASNAVTVYTSITAEPDPTTVANINFYSQLESYVSVDYDDGSLNINATGLSIYLDNDQTEGPDIFLRSGDDITLQAKNMSLGSEREGGDINLNAGDGADDDGLGNTASGGGDIIIDAGIGGDGNSSSGGTGGFTQIRGGTGGTAGVTNLAGGGGYVEIAGGSGGSDNGNTALGASGGDVNIYGGDTTREGFNGASVYLTSGAGGPNAFAGSVNISTPSSDSGPGGLWQFDGNGKLTFPGTPRIDTAANNFEVQAAQAINFEANTVVNIYTDASGNTYQWQFGDDGNTMLPGNSTINVPAGSDGAAGYNLSIKGGDADQSDYYTTKGGDINIVGGLGASNDGGGGGPGGNVNIIAGTSADTAGHSGNISISSGNLDWTFDYTGNLTLPGNTFAVNYANGTPVSIGGGSGNTGNVTFDNNIVIGTGDEYGGDGLFLATGPNGAANLQYLRLRGGDFPTHIHLDTGNNAFYDQYFGNDNKFVKLEAGDAGNVVIGTDDATGNLYNWTFTSDGNFILANGNSVIKSIANSSLDPLNPNVSTMVLTPSASYSSQALVLDPTAPGHIHLRAPGANIDEPSANIFLGGETSSFEVGYYNGSAPNVFVHSGNNTWTFDNTGNLTIPGSAGGMIKTVANGAIGITAINNGSDNPAQMMSWTVGETNPDTIISTYSSNALIQSNVNGLINTWTFDNAGNLTLPGSLIATSASPAPILNGFSVSNALSISGGNITATGTVTSTGKIGYSTGGNATQTSTGQGVTINQLTGLVTLATRTYNAGDLEAFSISCNKVSNDDFVLVQMVDSVNAPSYNVVAYPNFILANTISVLVKTLETVGSDTPILKFMIVKAPIA